MPSLPDKPIIAQPALDSPFQELTPGQALELLPQAQQLVRDLEALAAQARVYHPLTAVAA